MATLELISLSIIILIFSLVQSLFGVGLLLFGTPTLLLLGYSFDTTLWILLPSSVIISLSQIHRNSHLIKIQKSIYIATLPPLILGLFLVITNEDLIDITKIVGGTLIIIGLLRQFNKLEKLLKYVLKKNPSFFYFLLGGIHGFSNMGGGPLTALMSSIHENKKSIQANIAQVYLIFALSQLIVLSLTSLNSFKYSYLFFIIIPLISYNLIGKKLSKNISNKKYQSLITALILCYGLLSFL